MKYAAFLRGVMPTNANMADLRRAFEAAGFRDVRTVLSSGNVVFDAPRTSVSTMERKCETAMEKALGRSFLTLVRPVDALRQMIADDPFKRHRLPPDSKRIVTFLRGSPKAAVELPIEKDGARILAMEDGAVFSAYLPTPKGPVFMALLEKAFGKEQTTRTWQTVQKVAT